MKQIFAQHKVCAILRNISPEHLTEYAEALYNGGIRVFEVAFNTQNAGDQIRLLVHKFGGNALIGAGTVTTKERCLAAKEAGGTVFSDALCMQNHNGFLQEKSDSAASGSSDSFGCINLSGI